jgi:DnaJ-like protein
MTDERRKAYAVLGVEPGLTPIELRRRYRTLVRRWHPDRFATDPRSQAEAEARMREINHAYQVLTEEPSAAEASPASAPPPSYRPPEPGARLSQEQIDRMVEAIGKEGPLDGFLKGIPQGSPLAVTYVALLLGLTIWQVTITYPVLLPVAMAASILAVWLWLKH